VIFGGSGDDFVDGDAGHDSAFLDSGRDVQLDPGDGSDFIEGDTCRDTLLFNGSNAAENMSLSADGHSAVFLRDVGGIRMDMSDVEQVDVHALGGADHVTVNDVSGTDIGSVNVDLASATGTGDGSTDIVSVNGTESVDHIKARTDDTGVDVRGLQADVHIAGAETADQLQLTGLGGNDKIDVGDDVASVIGVTTDLGSGQR